MLATPNKQKSYADGKILLAAEGGVGIITLNNPEKRNAMSLQMWEGFGEALTEREEDAQRRLDFAAFAQQCFRELNPLVPLAMNWHVEIIAAKLAAVYRGEIPRPIVNVPPLWMDAK